MVFERATEFPTTEEHLRDCPAPRSAYGFSKLAGEVYCRALHDEHGLPYTICRPFNAYGPGELPDDEPGIAHMVPDVIRKVLAGPRPLPIFGSGEQTRTLTHVDDIADGIVTAMATPPARTRTSTSRPPRSSPWPRSRASSGRPAARTRPTFELEHLPIVRGRRAAPLALGGEGEAAARLGGAGRTCARGSRARSSGYGSASLQPAAGERAQRGPA